MTMTLRLYILTTGWFIQQLPVRTTAVTPPPLLPLPTPPHPLIPPHPSNHAHAAANRGWDKGGQMS